MLEGWDGKVLASTFKPKDVGDLSRVGEGDLSESTCCSIYQAQHVIELSYDHF